MQSPPDDTSLFSLMRLYQQIFQPGVGEGVMILDLKISEI